MQRQHLGLLMTGKAHRYTLVLRVVRHDASSRTVMNDGALPYARIIDVIRILGLDLVVVRD